MAKRDDWETLMNGAFGRGAKTPAASDPISLTLDPNAAPAKAAPRSTKRAATPASSANSAPSAPADPFAALTCALEAQQANINAQLKAQQELLDSIPVLTPMGDTAPVASAPHGEATSSPLPHPQTANIPTSDVAAMTAALEADGLLARGTSEVSTEHKGSFTGLAEELKQIVLGQDAFVDSLVRAMRRPFVLGITPPAARNVILLTGGEGTGRHFALPPLVQKMAARGLLQNDNIFTLDLSLYADSASEKIFLQDLYAALHASGEIVVFEGYERCHPSFLKTLATLAITGSAPLSSRYILNKDGILVDAGSALAPNAIREIDPCGSYLFFYSNKGKAGIADHFGADMLSAIGDVCTTAPFAADALAQIATTHLNGVIAKTQQHLGFALSTDDAVRDYIAAQAHEASGANGLLAVCDKIYRALSEYCLAQDTLPEGTMTLSVAPSDNTLHFALGDAMPAPLFALLPAEYQGSRVATEAALDALVGLDSVKNYVRALADNLEIQKRRSAAGMKNASISMHMIFSGNPGTGKTTIARLIAQYLKAIGALRGGQLIEVSRGDLVGRYSGHTAPLTNNVIESALGGVLFIDEAYSLYRGEQDSFGMEAIDTLVKGMEDHRDDLVVVLAGYTNEMNVFLTANSGLASRFSNNIEFPDYTAEELLAITKLLSGGKGYTIDASCDIALLGYYGAQQALHADTAGNGRLARNTLEKAILNQSKRLIATPEAPLDVLLEGDFELDVPFEAISN